MKINSIAASTVLATPFEWRGGNDGEMVVLLDDKEVIRTVDRIYDDAFDGFNIVNKVGEFEIKQVSIFGTQR